jgi:hypothetical protein
MNNYDDYDNYDVYEKYEDVLFKPKQKISKGKQHISCYSLKHVRIQQSKAFSKK